MTRQHQGRRLLYAFIGAVCGLIFLPNVQVGHRVYLPPAYSACESALLIFAILWIYDFVRWVSSATSGPPKQRGVPCFRGPAGP